MSRTLHVAKWLLERDAFVDAARRLTLTDERTLHLRFE
jgi:hypothetical protein